MKPKQLLQICSITSSSASFCDDRNISSIISALQSRRTTSLGRHQRYRRVPSAPSGPSFGHPNRQYRRRAIGEPTNCRSIQRLLRPSVWGDMGLERRLSRASPNTIVSLDAVVNASSTDLGPSEPDSATASSTQSYFPRGEEYQRTEDGSKTTDTSSLASMPPPPASETFETRSVRSTSSASRNANRLSLTLPIAPPNAFPSRPIPTGSMPPTPIDSSALTSPVDSNDFIIAIAAQERRVFELREELNKAESELKRLQRQWTIAEGCKMRPSNVTAEPRRHVAAGASLLSDDDDSPTSRRKTELERRKTILLAQSQNTPRETRRKVLRGGHTRTLSLLSPTKTIGSAGDVTIHEDQDILHSPGSYTSRSPVIAPLNKRATWAPRQTQHHSTPPNTGVKQLANDFRQGLWTFVEDLRQATVGDEGISSTTNRTSEMKTRSNRTDDNQDTIRASTANRGRIPFTTDLDSPDDSPSKPSKASFSDRAQHRRTDSKMESRTRKHFSWTPLTFENFDDDDWSNWDTPNVKSTRWSGSTVSGDIVSTSPDRADEYEATGGTLRRKRSITPLRTADSPKTPSKLEELPQAILNRLTPSNIKTTTSNFIKEWEKSLSPPADSETFNSELHDFTHSTQ
ncbi:hypothetical protein GGR57DRAFT_52484 [Xylariaceae sp. FL1272]|nr:hypothetical protein GGR57DRAFT_52484 [Xylariaceae sp. FL1272]